MKSRSDSPGQLTIVVPVGSSSTTMAPERSRQSTVSFANAPGTPDPSIAFTTERDQIQPIAPALIPVGAPA